MISKKHRSPSLTAIYNSVKDHSKHHILDLCSFQSANFRFFSVLGCRFQFLDLNEIATDVQNWSDSEFESHLDSLLSSVDTSRKFDIVLAWDFINFLDLNKLSIFFEKISRLLVPDALWHYYTFASSKRLSFPSEFAIQNKYYVAIKPSALSAHKNTCPSTTYLLKSLKNYYIWHSYNNLEGMLAGVSENILCFQPNVRLRKQQGSSAELDDAEQLVDKHFKSPIIQALRERRRGGRVLDLSRKSLLNEDQWKRHFDDVIYEDLQAKLRRFETFSLTQKQNFFDQGVLINYSADTKFDIVILWDLPDFCEPDFLKLLNDRLAPHCHTATTLIVMSHVSAMVPRYPLSFLLTKNGVGLSKRDLPRLVPRENKARSSYEWQKLFSHFKLKHTYAVRPGMLKGLTEYVLTFDQEAFEKKKRIQNNSQTKIKPVAV